MKHLIISRSLDFTSRIINNLPFGSRISELPIFNDLKKKYSINIFNDFYFLEYVKKKCIGLAQNVPFIDTLVLGSSTADYGFYSPAWPGTYNLGLTSTNLYEIYYLYKNYRNCIPNLNNIIVYFTVFSPGYSLINSSERYRVVAYNYYFKIPYAYPALIKQKYEKIIFNKCKKLKKINIEKQYSGYDKKTYYGDHISAQTRVRTHINENAREPNQLHWLKSLYDMVHSDKRKLIIVIPPFRSDYKKLLPEHSVLFNKLYKLDMCSVNYLNFYDSGIFDDTDFGDTDHLKVEGAVKLTNEIYKVSEGNDMLKKCRLL